MLTSKDLCDLLLSFITILEPIIMCSVLCIWGLIVQSAITVILLCSDVPALTQVTMLNALKTLFRKCRKTPSIIVFVLCFIYLPKLFLILTLWPWYCNFAHDIILWTMDFFESIIRSTVYDDIYRRFPSLSYYLQYYVGRFSMYVGYRRRLIEKISWDYDHNFVRIKMNEMFFNNQIHEHITHVSAISVHSRDVSFTPSKKDFTLPFMEDEELWSYQPQYWAGEEEYDEDYLDHFHSITDGDDWNYHDDCEKLTTIPEVSESPKSDWSYKDLMNHLGEDVIYRTVVCEENDFEKFSPPSISQPDYYMEYQDAFDRTIKVWQPIEDSQEWMKELRNTEKISDIVIPPVHISKPRYWIPEHHTELCVLVRRMVQFLEGDPIICHLPFDLMDCLWKFNKDEYELFKLSRFLITCRYGRKKRLMFSKKIFDIEELRLLLHQLRLYADGFTDVEKITPHCDNEVYFEPGDEPVFNKAKKKRKHDAFIQQYMNEGMSEKDAIEKAKNRKKKIILSGPVFSLDELSGTIEDFTEFGIPLERYNGWLTSLTYEQVPAILNTNIKIDVIKVRGKKDSEENKMFDRWTKEIRRSWNVEGGIPKLKEYLKYYAEIVLKNSPHISDEVKPVSMTFKTHDFIADDRMYLDHFSENLIGDREECDGKSKSPALYVVNDMSESVLEEKLLTSYIKGKVMSPQKLKCKCRSMRSMVTEQQMLNTNDSVVIHISAREVLNSLEFDLYLPKSNDLYEFPDAKKKGKMIGYNAFTWKKLSWCVCYLSQHFISLGTTDYPRFCFEFRKLLSELRNRILNVAREYLAIGEMTESEKKRLKIEKSNAFAAYMRTPYIQSMFSSGWTKKQVTDYIYQQHSATIREKAMSGESALAAKGNKKRCAQKAIEKERDFKYFGQVEPHMFSSTLGQDDIDRLKEANKSFERTLEDIDPQMMLLVAVVVCFFVIFILWYSPLYGFLIALISARCNRWVVWFFKAWIIPKIFSKVDDVIMEAKEDVRAIVVSYKDALFTMDDSKIRPKHKVMLYETKIVMHIMYHMTKGNKERAIENATHLMCSRPGSLIKVIDSTFHLAATGLSMVSACTYKVFGKTVTRSVDDFEHDANLYDQGITIDTTTSRANNNNVESNALGLDEFTKIFANLMSTLEVTNMSPMDVRNLNQQFAFIRNRTSMIQDSVGAFKTVVSFISRTMFAIDVFDPAYQKYVAQIVVYNKMVGEQINICSKEDVMLEYCNSIVRLDAVGRYLVNHPRLESIPSFLSRALSTSKFKLDELTRTAMNLKNGNKPRVEPLFVLFTGTAGCGKTKSAQYVLKHLVRWLHKLNPKLYPRERLTPDMMYTYNPDDDYFDTYRGQLIALIDEIFQSTDVEQLRKQAQVLISMINSAPFSLKTAYLEGKGQNFFTSEFIVSTSNYIKTEFRNMNWQELGLHDPDAFTRRCFLVLRRVKPWPGKVEKCTFVVDKIELVSDERRRQLIGRELGLLEIISLMVELKAIQRQRFHSDDLTEEMIDKHFEEMGMGSVNLMTSSDEIESNMYFIRKYERYEDEEKVFENIPEYLDLKETNPITYGDSEDEVLSEDDGLIKGEKREEEVTSKFAIVEHNKTDVMSEFDKRVNETTGEQIFAELLHSNVYEWSMTPKKEYMIGLAAVLLSVPLIMRMYEWLKPAQEWGIETHTWEKHPKSGRGKRHQWVGKGSIKRVHTKRMIFGKNIKPHSIEENFGMSLKNTVSKFVVCFKACAFTDETQTEQVGSASQCIGFHLKNNFYVVPMHFLAKFEDKDFVEYQIYIGGVKRSFYTFEAVVSEHDDIAIIKLDIKGNLPKSGYEYLLPLDEYAPINEGQRMTLFSVDTDGSPGFKVGTKFNRATPVTYPIDGDTIVIQEPLTYWSDANCGDSGSPVILQGKQGTVHIVGVHSAGSEVLNGRLGIAIPICRESIDHLMEGFGETVVANSAEVDDFFPMQISRRVNHDQRNFMNRKSRIKRSAFHEWYDKKKYIPARLAPKDGVDPYMKAVVKQHQEYTKPCSLNKEKIISYLMNLYPPNNPRVIPFEEVVNGIKGKEVTAINAGTSAGWPWNKNSPKGKFKYVEYSDSGLKLTDDFLRILQEIEAKLLNGEQVSFVWSDTLKDELRLREKVEELKTRLFATCPIDYLMLMRKYCLDLVAEIQADCVQGPIAVGIDPHSVEWTLLHNRLAHTADSVIAGDFSNYDGLLPRFVGEIVLEFINRWYNDGEVNARVRTLLFEHIYHAERIYGDIIYQVCDGNPSGNPITSIYNSLCNVVMCYVILTEDLGLDVDDYSMTSYGDDNVITIARPGYKCSDLTPYFMQRFGMTYTHFSKGEFDELDNLSTIRFLGRKFELCHRYILAPLDIDTIVGMLYWWKDGVSENEWAHSTIQSFVLECFHLGKERYDQLTGQFRNYVKEYHPEFSVVVRHAIKSWWDLFDKHYVRPTKVLDHKTYAFSHLIDDGYDFEAHTKSVLEFHFEIPLEDVKPHSSEDVKFIETKFPETNDIKTSGDVEMSDRAVIKPVETEPTQMGGFHDVSEVILQEAQSAMMQSPYQNMNMQVFYKDKVLARPYNIATYSWVTSQANGFFFTGLDFPSVLLNQAFIANETSFFKWFRGAIRVSIRVVSTPNNSGRIIVCWHPNTLKLPSSDYFRHVLTASGVPHVLLGAASGETKIIEIPWVVNERMLNLDSSDVLYSMGTIEIGVLNPLTNVYGEVSNAQILVTAEFVTPELMMPIAPHSTTVDFSSSGPFNSKSANKIRRIDSKHLTYTGKKSELPRMTVGKIDPGFDINNGVGKESITKFAMDPNNSLNSNVSIMGVDKDEMSLLGIAGTPMLARSVTVNSSDTIIPKFLTAPWLYNEGTYVDTVSNWFRFSSGSQKILLDIAATQYHDVEIVVYLTNDQLAEDYQNFQHNFYRIRGDTTIKFTLSYPSHKFMRQNDNWTLICKVISWSQPIATISAPIHINVYRAAADDYKWSLLKDNYFIPEAPQNLEFDTLEEEEFDVEPHSNPNVEFRSSFEFFHPDMSLYEHHGLVTGEEYTHLKQILQKTHAYEAHVTTGFRNVWEYLPNSSGEFLGLEAYGQMFYAYRGAIQIKLARKAISSEFIIVAEDAAIPTTFSGGMISTSQANNPVLELEIPYYNGDLYSFTKTGSVNDFKLKWSTSVDSTTNYLMKSAGNDFSFHWLMPARGVWGSFNSSTATRGFTGLRTFYST